MNIFFSAFGVVFVNMIFKKQTEFIQRLRVLVIGQLFLLISDITFFVIVKQIEHKYNFDFYAFLLALEICYFLSIFEFSLHSESLLRFRQEFEYAEPTLPSYEEAIIMEESRK